MITEHRQLDFCLLIPCYNNPQGLMASLESVFYDADRFAVVIIDDGSAIPVYADQIKSELKNIGSITVLRNEENRGITNALNRGLQWIEEHLSVQYIARLDCGDLCHPQRFYRQMEYMTTHPDIGLLGSWSIFEDKKSMLRYEYKTPTDHEKIKTQMCWRNVFIHPTVMFRADLISQSGYYPADFLFAEDYVFFWKLIKIAPSHILDQFLVTCEINKEGLSFRNSKQQRLEHIKVIKDQVSGPLMKIAGILRVKTLSLIPKRLVLPLKHWIKKQ